MVGEDKVGKDLAQKLTRLSKEVTKGTKISSLSVGDKQKVLEEFGFKPQEIASFQIVDLSRDSCDCACAPNKGFGTGCFATNGEGSSVDP
jgi:hypothetical protein